MQIIGITGGIGSGKSTLVHELACRGYRIYDCDREAKRIIETVPQVRDAVKALLGNESFVNHSYNTGYVARRVFAEPDLLERLNTIVHPAVKADITRLCKGTDEPLFVESAILYEAGLDALCHRIFHVDAPEDVRLARTIARDYRGDASAENIKKVRARMRAQEGEKKKNAIIVNNDGTASIPELADALLAQI